MGSLCHKKVVQTVEKTTEKGLTTRFCTNEEFEIWKVLYENNTVALNSINKQKKEVDFNFSDLNFEEIITMTELISLFDQEGNFFLMIKIIEIMIAIIDWLQIVLELKRKNKMTKFFLIYFDKFIIEKNKTLKYTDNKLNDPYEEQELCVRDDGLICSFSIVDHSTSFHKFMNNINELGNKNDLERKDSETAPDLNSYFYSRSKDNYKKLIKKYDFNKVEYFYSEVIINFISKFVLKKTNVNSQSLYSDFSNVKNLIRHSFKEIRKGGEVSLQKLKEFMSSMLYNNYEMNVFKHKMNDLITNIDKADENLINYINAYKQLNINLKIGQCDNKKITAHTHSFIYDNYLETPTTCLCIECSWKILLSKIPSGDSYNNYKSNNSTMMTYDKLTIEELHDLIKTNYPYLDVYKVLRYVCYINANSNYKDNSKDLMDSKNSLLYQFRKDIYLYKKQQFSVIFEYRLYDTTGEETNNEIFNYDMVVKDIINSKTKKNENSLLVNSDIRLSKIKNSFDIDNKKLFN